MSGAGSAAVTAYRIDPSAPAAYVAHALLNDGRILIAACPAPGAPLAIAPDGLATEVRLDITLDAAEPGVRITAATAHLLGSLTWIEEQGTEGVLASARTPACHCAITGDDPLERVGQVAGWPGGRLGVIATERVMLHCVTGVSSHTIPEVLAIDGQGAESAAQHPSASAWSSHEVLAAHESVAAVGELGLQAICDAVSSGEALGWVCSTRPSVGVCSSLWGRILCVDVDAHGATLMRITAEEITTLVVAFPDGPRAAHEVGQSLESMAAVLLPDRLSRP
nr:hypothetical protein [Actinomyces bowdenii]